MAENLAKWISWVKEKTSSMFLEEFLKTDCDAPNIDEAEADSNDVIQKNLDQK
ncbi:hypothetical protein CROQUDRAFT_100255 [Cronartium quercuum f. sp. fusiforme G11]|uniref:Uncharacterized protein n=1 Tax=Cronartium quercuum f. sp. fusiforme G11 TaxID=708437 RepID=A0A9P6N698_9BASI|nr:hypothetical protein CROQUDRAFT_100255 [Cronartium quercuum f. sp. fusiforme G11]